MSSYNTLNASHINTARGKKAFLLMPQFHIPHKAMKIWFLGKGQWCTNHLYRKECIIIKASLGFGPNWVVTIALKYLYISLTLPTQSDSDRGIFISASFPLDDEESRHRSLIVLSWRQMLFHMWTTHCMSLIASKTTATCDPTMLLTIQHDQTFSSSNIFEFDKKYTKALELSYQL